MARSMQARENDLESLILNSIGFYHSYQYVTTVKSEIEDLSFYPALTKNV